MNLKNKKVLIYGLGDSGRAVIKVLRGMNAHVSFYDDDVKFYDQIGFERFPEKIRWDLVVISPGIKCLDNQLLKTFDEKKIPVISELDFAYLHSRGRIVAITGTNGKTTVSMMCHRVLKASGFETFLCGNIGLPFTSICEQTTKNSIIVCEVSNFQLERSRFFRANVACILNVMPDHIDRHGTFEEYVKVKGKICDNMKHGDLLLLNLDDDVARKMVLHKKFQYFSKHQLKKGTYVWKNQIYVNRKSVFSVSDIPLLGEKNLENVLACVAICSKFKVTDFSAIKTFTPANHRMERVGEVGGVTYIDDSKATNVASTIACVQAFAGKKIVLLMGGLGKDIDYEPLFSIKMGIKMVVCFGQDKDKIADCAKKFGYACNVLPHFVDAVNFCVSTAHAGDYVILSPGCASFDEFSSYAERGDKFKELVLKGVE